jgi:hypothetical protein
MPESFVEIRLTQEEAVVLDCLLRRFVTTDRLAIEDHRNNRFCGIFSAYSRKLVIPLGRP